MTPIYTRCENCQLKFDYYGGEHAICSGCVSEAVKSVKDFENLALEWKDNYNKMKYKLEVRIIHLEQIIDDLKDEIDSLQDLT